MFLHNQPPNSNDGLPPDLHYLALRLPYHVTSPNREHIRTAFLDLLATQFFVDVTQIRESLCPDGDHQPESAAANQTFTQHYVEGEMYTPSSDIPRLPLDNYMQYQHLMSGEDFFRLSAWCFR